MGRYWSLPMRPIVKNFCPTFASTVLPQCRRIGVIFCNRWHSIIRTKRDNHLADCERMQFLAADVTGMLAGETPPNQGQLEVSSFDD